MSYKSETKEHNISTCCFILLVLFSVGEGGGLRYKICGVFGQFQILFYFHYKQNVKIKRAAETVFNQSSFGVGWGPA